MSADEQSVRDLIATWHKATAATDPSPTWSCFLW